MNPISLLKLIPKFGKAGKKAVKWAYNNTRLFVELVLVVLLVVVGWCYNRKAAELQKAKTEAGQLADGLQAQIQLKNGELEILRRRPDGTVSRDTVFVPQEGGATVQQKDMAELQKKYNEAQDKLAKSTSPEERKALQEEIARLSKELKKTELVVIVKDKGFCLRPGIGVEYGGLGLQLRGDLKVAYYKRYSVLLGGSRHGLDIGASRHLDDVLFWKPQNLEVWGAYKYLRMNGGNAVAGGLRVGF